MKEGQRDAEPTKFDEIVKQLADELADAGAKGNLWFTGWKVAPDSEGMVRLDGEKNFGYIGQIVYTAAEGEASPEPYFCHVPIGATEGRRVYAETSGDEIKSMFRESY